MLVVVGCSWCVGYVSCVVLTSNTPCADTLIVTSTKRLLPALSIGACHQRHPNGTNCLVILIALRPPLQEAEAKRRAAEEQARAAALEQQRLAEEQRQRDEEAKQVCNCTVSLLGYRGRSCARCALHFA